MKTGLLGIKALSVPMVGGVDSIVGIIPAALLVAFITAIQTAGRELAILSAQPAPGHLRSRIIASR